MTKTVAVEEAALREIVDELQADDEVVITRDGQPVARIIPIAHPRRTMTLEQLRAAVTFVGDVESPVD